MVLSELIVDDELKLQAVASVHPDTTSRTLHNPSLSESLSITVPVPSCSPEQVSQTASVKTQVVLSELMVDDELKLQAVASVQPNTTSRTLHKPSLSESLSTTVPVPSCSPEQVSQSTGTLQVPKSTFA